MRRRAVAVRAVGWVAWATIRLFTVVSSRTSAWGGKAVGWNTFHASTFSSAGRAHRGFLAFASTGAGPARHRREDGRLRHQTGEPGGRAQRFGRRVLTIPTYSGRRAQRLLGSMADFGTDHDDAASPPWRRERKAGTRPHALGVVTCSSIRQSGRLSRSTARIRRCAPAGRMRSSLLQRHGMPSCARVMLRPSCCIDRSPSGRRRIFVPILPSPSREGGTESTLWSPLWPWP